MNGKFFPESKYDVAVIGSGLGSLSAASLLANKGLKVLVAEQHYLPGGCCSIFRRNDFTFDSAVGMVFGFGNRGFNSHRFVFNEIGEDIDMVRHEALYTVIFGEKRIVFWPDLDRFIEELGNNFPGYEEQLRKFYNYLADLYHNVIVADPVIVPPTEIKRSDSLRSLMKHPVRQAKMIRLLFKSTEELMSSFIDPEAKELYQFFDVLTSTYCYTTVKETPGVLAVTMFIDNHEGGGFYPVGSSQMIRNKLEKAIEKNGGYMLYENRVNEILFDDGKATGIRLEDGSEIRSDFVIYGGTVWNLYGGIVPKEYVSQESVKWAGSLEPTFPAMVVYAAVDSSAIPAGTNPVEMFVEEFDEIAESDVTVYIPSIDEPSICPEGTHVMSMIAPSKKRWPPRGTKEYRVMKEDETERVIKLIEKRFPKLRESLKHLETATPLTIERYTFKNEGRVGGPKQSIGQELLKRLHAKSEWENLFVCGDSTVMGMGTPAVTVSGIGAANLVLRKLKMKEYSYREPEVERVHYTAGKKKVPVDLENTVLDRETVPLISSSCQLCDIPNCTLKCPDGKDIRGILRRLEAGNFIGAKKRLLETTIGTLCSDCAGFCEKSCKRLSFDKKPVPIKRLLSWLEKEVIV